MVTQKRSTSPFSINWLVFGLWTCISIVAIAYLNFWMLLLSIGAMLLTLVPPRGACLIEFFDGGVTITYYRMFYSKGKVVMVEFDPIIRYMLIEEDDTSRNFSVIYMAEKSSAQRTRYDGTLEIYRSDRVDRYPIVVRNTNVDLLSAEFSRVFPRLVLNDLIAPR